MDPGRAERGALADDLTGLTPDQWATRSLCPDWAVRDIVAHLTPAASTTRAPSSPVRQGPLRLRHVCECRPRPPSRIRRRVQAGGLSRRTALDDLAARSRPTWLGEVVVHAEDVRRPLGMPHMYPPEALSAVATFGKGSNTLIGAKKPDRRSHAHRTSHVDDLIGDGVETLRSRCR